MGLIQWAKYGRLVRQGERAPQKSEHSSYSRMGKTKKIVFETPTWWTKRLQGLSANDVEYCELQYPSPQTGKTIKQVLTLDEARDHFKNLHTDTHDPTLTDVHPNLEHAVETRRNRNGETHIFVATPGSGKYSHKYGHFYIADQPSRLIVKMKPEERRRK